MRPPPSPEERERRITAYHATDNDIAAAERVGMSRQGFRAWRDVEKLPAKRSKRLTEDECVMRYLAWDIGFTDERAAELFELERASYTHWRIENRFIDRTIICELCGDTVEREAPLQRYCTDCGFRHYANRRWLLTRAERISHVCEVCGEPIPPDKKKCRDCRTNQNTKRAQMHERRILWEKGLTDKEIAISQGISQNSVSMWRDREGLAPNRPIYARQERGLIEDIAPPRVRLPKRVKKGRVARCVCGHPLRLRDTACPFGCLSDGIA